VYNFFMSSKLIYIDWKKYYPKGSMPQKNETNWINITAVSSSNKQQANNQDDDTAVMLIQFVSFFCGIEPLG
jgi:hypothetical protein